MLRIAALEGRQKRPNSARDGEISIIAKTITSALMARTIKGRSPALRDAADSTGVIDVAVTPRASLAFTPIDREPVLEVTKLTRGPPMITQAGAPRFYGLTQDLLYRRHQPRRPHRPNGPGLTPGRKARPVKRLANVNIAETGYDPLIQ
jgi:hypothetical protein